jgi:primosomal protein N''
VVLFFDLKGIRSDHGVNDPNSRKQFRKNLLKCMKKCITDKEEMLLAGNFNEALGSALGSDHQGMAKIFRELNLVDVMSAMHGAQDFSTHAREKERLDCGGGTARAAEACENGGCEPFKLRFGSDHRGFFLDFNAERLLGAIHHLMAPKSLRAVRAEDPKGNTNYVQTKHEHLEHQKFYRNLAMLSETQEPKHDLAERLDNKMIRAANTAAKRCKKRRNTRWSRKLDLARKRQTVMHTVLTQHGTKQDMSQSMHSLQTQGASDFTIPLQRVSREAKGNAESD